MYYIGFDIAKENHYASIANSNGEVIQEAFLVKNSINGFNYFMDKLKEHNINISDCLVGMESTGHYGENLIQFLHSKDFNIGVINPIQTDALRNSNIRKTKTDKIDNPNGIDSKTGNTQYKEVNLFLIQQDEIQVR